MSKVMLCAFLLLLTECGGQSIQLQSADGAGDVVDLSASLTTPSGKGPFPAAVLMHACGGLSSTTGIPGWEGWFYRHGYATLTVDSFTGRGWSNVCGNSYLGGIPGSHIRIADARAAFQYLRNNPIIDSKRVVLIGFSHGGTTTLLASLDRPPLPYAGFIALYPGCYGTSFSSGFTAPTMILIGDQDDWTPADACKSRLETVAGPIELHIYPGASHGFDRPGPTVFPLGHRLEGSPQATSRARADVENFLMKLGGGRM
jgi:dienelactone hydrolase